MNFIIQRALALVIFLLLAISAQGNLLQSPVAPSHKLIPPPQAIAAGYTINALNSDFSQSFDHECSGGDAPGLWHVATLGILLGNCDALAWPDTDQDNRVLTIKWTDANRGAQQGRQGIVTESASGAFTTTFPVKGYFECTARMAAHVSPTQEVDLGQVLVPGPWFSCWQWESKTQPPNPTGCNVPPSVCYERDLVEVHGLLTVETNPIWIEFSGGMISYGAGGILAELNRTNGDNSDLAFESWCSRAPCTTNGATVGPVYDPSQYHRYGVLFTEPTGDPQCGGNPCIRSDFYIDDNGPYVTMWGNASGAEFLQRSFLIANVTTGCWQAVEGADDCNNVAVTAANNASGQLQLTLGQRPDCDGIDCLSDGSGGVVYMSGVGGNVPDGNYGFNVTNPNGDPAVINLTDIDTGTILLFTGGYTGGGMFNPLTSADMHIKSYRVWVGCSAWRTTQC
jgi:hypothetical protein